MSAYDAERAHDLAVDATVGRVAREFFGDTAFESGRDQSILFLSLLRANDCLPGGLVVVEAARMKGVIDGLINTSENAVAAQDAVIAELQAENDSLRKQIIASTTNTRGQNADDS